MSLSSLSTIPVAYATASAGMHPSHTLPKKLKAIAAAGFTATEIAFPDLEDYAASKNSGYKKLDDAGEGDLHTLLAAAGDIRTLLDELKLKALTIMPFSQYEGYEDTKKQLSNLNRAHAWFKVMQVLGCGILQVGSTDDAATSSSYDKLATDLRALADEAAKQTPPITIAYEMWSWGVHVNTWEQVWDMVVRVDRPNFGINLDTFQILARAWADIVFPSSSDRTLCDADQVLHTSLTKLTSTLSDPKAREKIVYLQISDGSKHVKAEDLVKSAAKAPNETTGKSGIHPLYKWSDEWRPLPAEGFGREDSAAQHGGYLPVVDVCEAILKTGWRGPWSYEVFWAQDMSRDDPTVPERWTRDAKRCHHGLLSALAARGLQ